MSAFIAPPTRIPLFLKAGIWISEKITGKPMLPARLLAWYPKAALGSAMLEGLVAHHDGKIDKRMLKLVRLSASFAAACPFCIDMNSTVYRETGITDAEFLALQNQAGDEELQVDDGHSPAQPMERGFNLRTESQLFHNLLEFHFHRV